MGSKSSGAPAQPSQQPDSSISNGFGGASNSAASPQIPQQPIAQAVNQTGAVTAPSLTDQVVLQNQNNAIAANQQPNPMAMTAYRNNMSPQIPMPSLTEQPMFQQSYYQRPDQQAMMESLRQILPNMFGNRYFASGGAVHGYDKETIKNALRIASRKNHPMRLHQTLARTGYAEGGDIPLPPKRPEDLDYYKVLAEAQKNYPFIEKHDPYLKVSPRSEAGYAETFGPTEEGAGEFMRPKEFPLGSTGIEVYRPDEFTPADYAAEFLHVDPKANEARNALIEKLTPRQKQMIMQEPDYTDSIKQKLSPRKALENVTDAMLRGYTMKGKPSHQWPGDFLDKLEFTPEEREIMDSLKDYMVTPAESGPVVREQKSLGGYPKESAETSGEDIGHRAWETQHDRLNRQIERVQQDKDAYDYKSGGRINTVIDRDPDWKMGLAQGGEVVEEALRLASGGRTPAWRRNEY